MGPVRFLIAVLVALTTLTVQVAAQGKTLTLSAPPEIVDSGLLRFMLPRFALKHGVRVSVTDAGADVALAEEGEQPVFSRGDQGYAISVASGNDNADVFITWLTSEIGLRTVLSYKVDGESVFGPPLEVAAVEEAALPEGNLANGEAASLRACGRCHVVSDANRMSGIGSTPSFAVLRTLEDWQERFETFYVLNPHPAFTIIPEVIEEFDDTLPSPIAPVSVTLEELEDIVAFVAAMSPADLGAPIAHQ